MHNVFSWPLGPTLHPFNYTNRKDSWSLWDWMVWVDLQSWNCSSCLVWHLVFWYMFLPPVYLIGSLHCIDWLGVCRELNLHFLSPLWLLEKVLVLIFQLLYIHNHHPAIPIALFALSRPSSAASPSLSSKWNWQPKNIRCNIIFAGNQFLSLGFVICGIIFRRISLL